MRVRYTKYGGSPHWEMDLRDLGEDDHGRWLGSPAGMPMRRPGMESWTEAESAFLVPWRGDFVASFNGPAAPVAIYVDVTDTPSWTTGRVGDEVGRVQGDTVRAVDLDLDVVQLADGTLFVDDEDEFEEHQVRYGYPADVISAAQASCDAVVAAIVAREEPWASIGHRWSMVAADVGLAPIPDWANGGPS